MDDKERMKRVIENINAWIQASHGGSVDLVDYDGETLKVRLGGACTGCPMSTLTLKMGIENTVRQLFPDLKQVLAV